MSLFPAVMSLIKCEHDFRPIRGHLLLIGRQRIEESEQTDKEFFASFCDAEFHALDVSDFEGADIIADLNYPVSKHLHGITDFIFNGSCLDNIFNAAVAIQSLSRMLRPGGRMVLMEHGTGFQGPGAPCGALTIFSPEWFFDFFAASGYADCQVYLGIFPKLGMFHRKWTVRQWEPFDESHAPVNSTPTCGDFVNLVIAEKGISKVDQIMPIQAQYRVFHNSPEQAHYLDAHIRYRNSARRAHHGPRLKDIS